MIDHRYADVNGVRLHYATQGTGELMLFVHGFPEFWYAWKNQLLEFGRDYQAVAPDMRGYNLSSKPSGLEKYEIQHMVEDLRALAAHLGHQKFVLVGHDWGGLISWAFAAYLPRHLEKLIIVNAPHPAIFRRELRENAHQQKASQYMILFRSSQAEEILSANNYALLVEAVMGEGLKAGHFTEGDRQAYLEAWSQPGALTGGLNYYRAARLGPLTGDADVGSGIFSAEASSFVVKVPTMVIWGEQDKALLPSNLDGLDQFVPALTLRRIPESTHWVVHEKPALVNSYIREFVQMN